MGAYKEKGRVKFITGDCVSKLFKSIARNIYPDMSKKELSQHSAHMIRVTAAVLLQISDKGGDFIRSRLRWESKAYHDYLRNTDIMAHKHVEAMGESSFDMSAYSVSAENLSPPLSPATPQMPLAEFGEYV